MQNLAPRLNECLRFKCQGLRDTNIGKLKLCLGKLNYVTKAEFGLLAEQEELLLFLDVLAEVKPSRLENIFCHANCLVSSASTQIRPAVSWESEFSPCKCVASRSKTYLVLE